ncbi:hypothetical protein AB0L65_20700 [Nonomuraea sp. NPDC052116]|uniref:hypothetical protein n=1 Tax=Nonomuraea sp. NPDC052116 TaxID=3155665 RepID=UPI003438EB95
MALEELRLLMHDRPDSVMETHYQFIIATQHARVLSGSLRTLWALELGWASTLGATAAAPHTAKPAIGLVSMLVRALPAEYRQRYAEELYSELYDLAQARATTSMQVYHALRQLTRTWHMRRALKNPTGRPLEPLFSATCWVLSSEARTWLVIGLVTLTALMDVVAEQGWGSALLTAPTAWMFHQGARWLRKRLGLNLKEGNEE